jgi:hypothetical protein
MSHVPCIEIRTEHATQGLTVSRMKNTFCSIASVTSLILSARQAKIVFGFWVSSGDVLPANVGFKPKSCSSFVPFAITKLESCRCQHLCVVIKYMGRGGNWLLLFMKVSSCKLTSILRQSPDPDLLDPEQHFER